MALQIAPALIELAIIDSCQSYVWVQSLHTCQCNDLYYFSDSNTMAIFVIPSLPTTRDYLPSTCLHKVPPPAAFWCRNLECLVLGAYHSISSDTRELCLWVALIEDLTSILEPLAFSGRWVKSPEWSLRAASWWSISSVSFFFTGTRLSFQAGPRTGRQLELLDMANSNGGTPVISIRVSSTEDAVLKSSAYWRTANPEPNSEVLILDETTHPNLEKKTTWWWIWSPYLNWAHWSMTMWVGLTISPV